MDNLLDLYSFGQSYWLDNLSREKILGGELRYRVNKRGLKGVTSNPAIFQKAIAESNLYDEQISEMVIRGMTPSAIYEELTIKDIQDACDILYPVYTETSGADGYVSLEVSPHLARNTEGTIQEARRLFEGVGRENCFIKIPGTREGLPAIEAMIYEGVPVNITLLFSVERYTEVAFAYIRALERRVAEGKPVDKSASVASFFLSRIDVLIDQLLSYHIIPDSHAKISVHKDPLGLMGKTAIASARLAYQRFQEIFSTPEWKKLEALGARVQRPLWASTGNKDPLCDPLRYVETLVGSDTVNTMPDETIEALDLHGNLRPGTILEDIGEARHVFTRLRDFDIDIRQVTHQLEDEGIRKFIDAYNKLMADLSVKRRKVLSAVMPAEQISAGTLKSYLAGAYSSLDDKQTGRRLFAKSPAYGRRQ